MMVLCLLICLMMFIGWNYYVNWVGVIMEGMNGFFGFVGCLFVECVMIG